ncbi:ATP-binding protein [Actibacterium lipolyticum]|uniref:histidine kinase n=1 Tax=Actibacterium lipolyticum TaxID=1524263 RepID=A0A238JMF9_9RHOB|nr:ATP-binding protein [Actibacterium lipolyticum]SMX31377.1 Sensor histidine kinase RcsC [Actibacterium lipolyticum]
MVRTSTQASATLDAEDQFDSETGAFNQTKVILNTSWGIILSCLGWIALSYYLEELLIAAIIAPALLGTIVAMVLAKLGKPLLARVIWVSSGIVAVTLANFTLHPAANPEIMYLVLIGGPFLTFAIGRENLQLALTLSATAVSLSSVLILGHDYFGPPLVSEEVAEKYIAPGTLVMVLVLVSLEMATFGIMAHHFQEKLEASRKKARLASRAKTDFLAAMSHEIRTPMNGVVGMIEILENSNLSTEQCRIVETIHDSSMALLTIIEDILDMSRIEAGKLELALQKTDILSVFEKSADTLRPFAEAHNVCLSIYSDPNLPQYMTCDPGRLRQITLNLLSNAIKFSKRPAEDECGHAILVVQLGKHGALEIIVADDGIGIDSSFLENLFDPFEQSSKVKVSNFGGSGLGLAIVAQLVGKFGGVIEVASELGQGATFTVQMPIVDPEGRVDPPDLRGKTIACYKGMNWSLGHFQQFVETCNGAFKVYETKEDLVAAAQSHSEDVVYLVCYRDENSGGNGPTGRDAWDFPPDTKAIYLTRSQNHLSDQYARKHIVLLGGPVLPSAFADALRRAFDPTFVPQEPRGVTTEEAQKCTKDPSAPRILAAEDNKINRLVLVAQLEKLGFTAVVVEDGAKAYELWKRGSFDLILTDCQMPELDGFELTRMIRTEEAQNGGRRIPIIAITANALRGEADHCLSVGMDGYLSKPTSLSGLEDTLNRHLAKDVLSGRHR